MLTAKEATEASNNNQIKSNIPLLEFNIKCTCDQGGKNTTFSKRLTNDEIILLEELGYEVKESNEWYYTISWK